EDEGGDEDDEFTGGEPVGEFTEGVVHGGAHGELVGDLGEFLAGRRLQFLGRHADGGAQGEAGLGGVGEDAGEFGKLVDELLDAFLALPGEELDRKSTRLNSSHVK